MASLIKWLRDRRDDAVDVVSANTQRDQQRRMAAGQPRLYQEQQQQRNQAALQAPKRSVPQQVGYNVLGGAADFIGKIPGSVADLYGSQMQTNQGKIQQLSNPLTSGTVGLQVAADLAGKKLFGADKPKVTELAGQRLINAGKQSDEAVANKVQQSRLGQRQTDNRLVAGGSRAVGQLGGQIATTFATKGNNMASSVIPALQTTADQRRRAIDAGKSRNEAMGIGQLQGAVQGATEKIGLDRLKIPGGNNLITRTGSRFLTEGAQEGGQQLAQNLITNKTYDRNQGLKDGVAESALFGGIAGGVGGAAFDLPNIKIRPLNNEIGAIGRNVLPEGQPFRINNPDNANVGGFKINNPDNARVGGLAINNPDGAQVRPLQIKNPEGANMVTPPLRVRNNTGAPLVGDNLSGAAQQSYLSKLRDRATQFNKQLGEEGFVKNPFGKDIAEGLTKEQSDFINNYANMLEDMGSGNGVSVTQDGKRVSNNFRTGENKGKKMTKADWFEQARKEIESGKAGYGASEEYATLPRQESKPKGFILAEGKPRNGRIDTIRASKDPNSNRLIRTQQSELTPEARAMGEALGLNEQQMREAQAQDALPYNQKVPIREAQKAAGEVKTPDLQTKEARETLVPPKTLKDAQTKANFVEATKKYLGNKRASEIERQAKIADLNTRYKLSEAEKLNAIIAIDDSAVTPKNPKVQQYVDEFRALTDTAFQDYTSNGINMGYVQDYLPRIYKNPETGKAISKPEYELLMRMSGRMKGRTADSVNVDDLLYKDPTQLLNNYYSSLDKTVAGRQYLNDLEKSGVVVKSNEPVRGLRPILAEGLQPSNGMVYYANKDVQQKLDRLFGDNSANNFVEKTLEKLSGLNSFVQSFVLSGGVPNTPINAFGVMQVMKEGMALHPIKAGRAFYTGLSKNNAKKLFADNKDYLQMMARNDIDVRVNLEQTAKSGTQRISQAFTEDGRAAGLNQAWDEFTNDATFGRFMPALELMHFKNIYKQQLRRGADPVKAEQTAAQSVKNFYGKPSNYTTTTRSKASNDALGAVFFAPRFRESMVNFWIKNVKALGNPTNPAYRDNVKFMVAAGLTYAAMNALQNAFTGDDLWENPEGKTDKLIVPSDKLKGIGINTNGKDVGIPFLPSLATVPRNLASLAANTATGNFEEAGKNAKSFLSMPLKTAGDLLTNENYFGQKIIDKEAPGPQKFAQAASYVGSSNMQPWVREGLNMAGQNSPDGVKKSLGIKEKSGVETASNALELPFRFYDPNYYKKDGKFVNRQGQDKEIKKDGKYVKLKDLPLGERFDETMKDLGDSGDSEAVKQIVTEIDGELNTIYGKYGLPNPGTDTRIAEVYADYHKKLGSIGEIEKRSSERKLLRDIYKSTLDAKTSELFGISSDNDIRLAVQDGLVNQDTMNKAIELDNFLVANGLQSSPTIGNKLRRELGYASISSGSGRGRGGRGAAPKVAKTADDLPTAKPKGVSLRKRPAPRGGNQKKVSLKTYKLSKPRVG